jgi:ornithine decarboxylase
MTTQVQSIPANIGFGSESLSSNHGNHTADPTSSPTRTLNVQTSPQEPISPPRAFGLGLPSPPPERDDEELPVIHSVSTDDLLRSGIMKASLATTAASNEPDAEAAFFVADLGEVYRQHLRWKKCLPNVTPFYGTLSPIVQFEPVEPTIDIDPIPHDHSCQSQP